MITTNMMHPKVCLVLRKAAELKSTDNAFSSEFIYMALRTVEKNKELQQIMAKLLGINTISPSDIVRAAEIIAEA